jgi:hypothetical protein
MHAITIREPWASLVMLGQKRIETRSWPAPDWLIGQRIAIHAAKGLTYEELAMVDEPEFAEALMAANLSPYPHGVWSGPLNRAFDATRGRVIATAVLDDCVPLLSPLDYGFVEHTIVARSGHIVHVTEDELAFGFFAPDRYGWLLRDVRPLPEPIPARGALGVWEWDGPDGRCVRCGAAFAVVERHPMVTNDQWCPACLPIVRAEAFAEVTA